MTRNTIPRFYENDVAFYQSIGRGSFSTVHKCLVNAKVCAIKAIKVSHHGAVSWAWLQKRLKKEIRYLWDFSIQCNRIVGVIGEYYDDHRLTGYIMNFHSHGNMRQFLLKLREQAGGEFSSFPWLICRLLQQVAEGMRFLHSRLPHPILHKDLAVDNVLVTTEFEAKLCDFGLTRAVTEGAGQSTLQFEELIGLERRPPEVVQDPVRGQTVHTDVYLFGVCMYEALCCGDSLRAQSQRGEFGSRDQFRQQLVTGTLASVLREHADSYCFGQYPVQLASSGRHLATVRDTLLDLMQQCMCVQPSARCNFTQCMATLGGVSEISEAQSPPYWRTELTAAAYTAPPNPDLDYASVCRQQQLQQQEHHLTTPEAHLGLSVGESHCDSGHSSVQTSQLEVKRIPQSSFANTITIQRLHYGCTVDLGSVQQLQQKDLKLSPESEALIFNEAQLTEDIMQRLAKCEQVILCCNKLLELHSLPANTNESTAIALKQLLPITAVEFASYLKQANCDRGLRVLHKLVKTYLSSNT